MIRGLYGWVSLLTIAACHHVTATAALTPERAVNALQGIRGRFADVGDGAVALLPATASDDTTLRRVSALDAAVVPRLIDCLSDTSLAKVEYDGAAVTVGAVCFSALLGTRFVQGHLGRGAPGVPAWVSYRTIDAAEQQQARREWEAWLKRQR